MSLKIVYGKSGTGKSSYIFNEIAKKIQNNNKKIYVITPEQFSFTAEKKLLDSLPVPAVIDAEVLTFNRMAYRVINSTRRADNKSISHIGKSMLIYYILLHQKNNLKFIGKSSENVDTISKQITEFKKHNISADLLEEATNEMDDKYLKTKMEDMLLMYQLYTKAIQEQYMDENDTLTILAEKLQEVEEFKNCQIYIDEFAGFTKQEYAIIQKLLENGNDITLTICADNLDTNTLADTDIFYDNKQTLKTILDIARTTNTELKESICLNEMHRFKTKELKHLEQNIYSVPYKKYEEKVQNIRLFLAKSPYSEIEEVGAKIVKLVREEGYRYRDIAVITKNLDNYASLCKAIFNQYHIPVFIDEKKDLSQNIIVKYLLAVLNIFAQNFSYEAMFGYMKTGLLEIDDMDINILENYCIKWGIKGSRWYQGEWDFYNEDEETQKKLLHLREVVTAPLLEMKNNIGKSKAIENMTTELYNFLIKNSIPEKLEKKIEELENCGEIEKANEYETSWGIIVDIMDEIVAILGDKTVTFEQYADILKIGLGQSSLGKIPATQDQVIIGDVDRSRSHKVKAVFMIGLNDGMFPSIHKNEGFFNDLDREKLKQHGTELAKGTLENIYADNFNIYKAFSTAEEKIYLSYASADLSGSTLRPSILINRIKKIFPKLQEESDVIQKHSEILTEETTFEELLNKIQQLKQGEEIEAIWLGVYQYYATQAKWQTRLSSSMQALLYTNNPEKISKQSIEKLYGNTLKTSVSRLEQYQACPFSYYLKYGLKLTQKNEFKIQTVDTGTFMHEVIDTFFEKLSQRGISYKQISQEEIKNILEEVIEEKLALKKNRIFTSIPKYRTLANRLSKVIYKSMIYIIDSLKHSKFEILGNEVEFKQGKEYPPIRINLEDGRTVEITGKIDRVDIAKTPDGNYIRIIDYKSSAKDINLNEVISGLQLQLLTYLDAVCEKENTIPAGVLYFRLMDPIIKAAGKSDAEEIEQEIRKQFKMKGLILADIDITKKMDTTLAKGNSNIIPAYIDKEGNLSNRSSNISRSQFENLQKYTQILIKKIANEILSGNIELKPYYKVNTGKTPCEYCDYRSICNFNSGLCKNSYQYIPNFNKEYLLEKINKEVDTNNIE